MEKESGWAYPIQTSARSRLREVYKDYGRFSSWAKKLNKYLRENYTEEKMYQAFIDAIYKDASADLELQEWLNSMQPDALEQQKETIKEYE